MEAEKVAKGGMAPDYRADTIIIAGDIERGWVNDRLEAFLKDQG